MAHKISTSGTLVAHRTGKMTVIELPEASLVNRGDLERVCAEIEQIINATNPPEILLSFANVTHVSSTFLGKLIAFNKRAKQKGGRLALTNVSDQLNELFVVTKLNSQIPIFKPGEKVLPTTIAWVTLFSVMSGSGLIGLIFVIYLCFNGRPRRGTPTADWAALIAMIYFILTIPLAFVVFKVRRAILQLEGGLQWIAVAVFSVLALVLFLAFLLAQ